MEEDGSIQEEFPNEKLLALSVIKLPWHTDIVNLVMSIPTQGNKSTKKNDAS